MQCIRLSLIFILCFASTVQAQRPAVENAMRIVGDKLLTQSNDSTSRVLAIDVKDQVYLMRFENDLQILPDSLVSITKNALNRIGLQTDYVIEVLSCDSQKVVYSYQRISNVKEDLVACKMRVLPHDCYQIRLFASDLALKKEHTVESTGKTESAKGRPTWFLLLLLLIPLAIYLIYRLRHAFKSKRSENAIPLGKFRFRPNQATLIFGQEKVILSGKESMLLELLIQSVNHTVEREVILQQVWGDDGDYVGRTLDVFISKLRKKLAADPEVKIINVRSVGYRLVVAKV